MIGAGPETGGWLRAGAGSLALHLAAAGWLVWPTLGPDTPTGAPDAPSPIIEVVALPDPGTPGAEAAAVPVETLSTVALPAEALPETPPPAGTVTQDSLAALPADVGEMPLVAEATPAASPVAPPPLIPLDGGPALPDQAATDPAAAPPLPPAAAAAPDTVLTLPPTSSSPTVAAPPPDPRLVELAGRIRARLADPCLLALPTSRDGQLALQLLSDSDRNLSALVETLTAGIDDDITGSAQLLDARQCAAVVFARRDPHYPVLPLGIALDHAVVDSGELLQGRVTGGLGQSVSLLLVDDNGVVHDLGPFLRRTTQEVSFAVPLALVGRARDTRHLLIALAAPHRPATVAARRGEAAAPFFDALHAEIGQSAQVGITSFGLR